MTEIILVWGGEEMIAMPDISYAAKTGLCRLGLQTMVELDH